MLPEYRIIRDASRRVAAAANGTVEALEQGRVEQEPAFTDRMLGRIEQAMEGYSHHGVSWTAKTLTDRGPGAQESRFGADFFGVLDIRLPGYSLTKGFLAQAKLVEPGSYFSPSEAGRLREQCERMLRLSASSFVFLYSRGGIVALPAIAVIASARTNPHNLYSRSAARFFEEHFASFLGDRRISVPEKANLDVLAEEYAARSGIRLAAGLEGAAGAAAQQQQRSANTHDRRLV